jgi:hypothetical protein
MTALIGRPSKKQKRKKHLAKLTRPAVNIPKPTRRSPRKEPQSNFIRNDVPLLLKSLPEFNITLSKDPTKITQEEFATLMTKAAQDAGEAYIRREAEKDPEGHFAKTYFTRIETQ